MYRFESGESTLAGVQRVAGEELSSAVEWLANAERTLDERVHETRKHMKKLRALLSLCDGALEGAGVAELLAAVKHAAHTLAELRGRAALRECFEHLHAHFPDALGEDSRARVAGALAEPAYTDGFAWASPLSEAHDVLDKARAGIATFDLSSSGWSSFKYGFRDTYARARSALRHAAARPSGVALHAFRVPAKRHMYHVQLLESAWERPLSALRHELADLSELLGEHHDLCLLGLELGRHVELEPDIDAVGTLIGHRLGELEANVVKLGTRLFSEKPKAVGRRFGAYFKVSRERSD